MAENNNRRIAASGSKIMAEARKIKEANPSKDWRTCVKEAGLAFRKNK